MACHIYARCPPARYESLHTLQYLPTGLGARKLKQQANMLAIVYIPNYVVLPNSYIRRAHTEGTVLHAVDRALQHLALGSLRSSAAVKKCVVVVRKLQSARTALLEHHPRATTLTTTAREKNN